jgi:hypothetical protein
MANHARAKLLCPVGERLMELLASEALRASFGDFYTRSEGLCFERRMGFDGKDDLGQNSSLVWSDNPSHVEMRHSLYGLDVVAQQVEFQALAACFGAMAIWDDGWRETRVPGRLNLSGARRFNGGFGDQFVDESGSRRVSMWLLSPPQEERARRTCDPRLFERAGDQKVFFDEKDEIAWGAKIDWAAAVDSVWPEGVGFSVALAKAALLPSAALNQPCHRLSLEKAGRAGLVKALALALVWASATPAGELLGELEQSGADAKSAFAAAKTLRNRWLGARKKMGGFKQNVALDQARQSLLDALELDLSTPRAPRRAKAAL